MRTQSEKFDAFADLHAGDGCFVIANAWNAGSAKILDALGFQALATTSAGLAFAIGVQDSTNDLDREATLANAKEIVEATSLPVSADLENGFADSPDDCASIIGGAIAAGLVGCTIEDATGVPDKPIYDFQLAVDRISACVEAGRGQNFLLTARSENFLHGRPDLDDTIRRLQAFEKAGADVLYAPGLPDLEVVRTVCKSVDKPVNVVMGLSGPTWSVGELSDAGVKRISVGGSFARAALGGLVRAAEEVLNNETFTYARDALPHAEAVRFMTATGLR